MAMHEEQSPPRILIVDDDEVISRALFQHLIETGTPADLALDGGEAERLAASNAYEIVLIDAYLTGHLHGRATDLVERLRRLSPASHIVVLTSYGSAELMERLAHVERITILAKPKPVPFIAEFIQAIIAGIHPVS